MQAIEFHHSQVPLCVSGYMARMNEMADANRFILEQNLHWLPVRSRIDFKLATLCYCSRTLDQPHYLSALLLSHRPERLLRSSAQEFLSVSRCNTDFGDRRFSVAAPRVWNSLPLILDFLSHYLLLKRI